MRNSTFNNILMQEALKQAQLAKISEEVPVGAIIVNNQTGKIIAKAFNMVETQQNPLLHAEILAIFEACKNLSSKNLKDHDIYITLEPCAMCCTAISFARIDRVYYGACDEKQGAAQNGIKFFHSNTCLHKPEIYEGIMAKESEELLKSFFKQLRQS